MNDEEKSVAVRELIRAVQTMTAFEIIDHAKRLKLFEELLSGRTTVVALGKNLEAAAKTQSRT